jgi:hypothetical protein
MVQMSLRFAETPELEGTTDAYAGLNWSYSRREALEHCTRRYFFQYYASTLPTGEFKTKVNFLRGVKNRYLRTGEIAHLMIATYFKKLKIGRNLSEDWLSKWAKDLLLEDRRYSLHIRNGGAFAQQQFPPTILDEVLNGSEGDEVLLDHAKEQMLGAIQNFFRSPAFAEFRSLGALPEARIECKLSLPGFPVPVTGKIDLAAVSDANATLVDWKIGGSSDGGTESLQLATYGFWATTEFRTDEQNVRIVKAYLTTGEVVQFNIDLKAFVNARVRILQDLERMVILHRYGKSALIEAFTPNPQEGVCRLCPFREVCPEGKAAIHA